MKQVLALALALLLTGCSSIDSSSENQIPETVPSQKFFTTDSSPKEDNLLKTQTPDFDFPIKTKAPDFVGLKNWINTDPIPSLNSLQGQVVLVYFWTFGCINCINTFEQVESWHKKYSDKGFTIIGIHRPEFAYERKLENLKNAVKKHQLTFPIVQDNEAQTWRAYKNRYWPAMYLIDKEGFIRYKHFGEGQYDVTEKTIQKLINHQNS